MVFVSHESLLYGAPRSLLILLAKAREAFEVQVFTYGEGDFVDAVRELGLPITVLELVDKPATRFFAARLVWRLLSRLRALRNFSTLSRAIARIRPALVYVNTIANPYPVLAAKRAGRRVVVHVREGSNYVFPRSGRKRRRVAAIAAGADRFICVSQAVADLIRRRVDRDIPVDVVHNGIDAEHFCFDPQLRAAARREMGIDNDEVVIGFIGSLSKRKGVDVFLEAAQRLAAADAKVHFLVVGGTPEASAALARGIDLRAPGRRFTFLPFTLDIRRIHCAIDVFSMTSRIEPFARVNLEASSTGRAIVATDTDGNREIFRDGYNALLVPAGSVTALEAAWERLVRDGGLRARLGHNALDVVRSRFTEEDYTSRVVEILRDELGRG